MGQQHSCYVSCCGCDRYSYTPSHCKPHSTAGCLHLCHFFSETICAIHCSVVRDWHVLKARSTPFFWPYFSHFVIYIFSGICFTKCNSGFKVDWSAVQNFLALHLRSYFNITNINNNNTHISNSISNYPNKSFWTFQLDTDVLRKVTVYRERIPSVRLITKKV